MTSYSKISPASIGTGVAKTNLGNNNKPSDSQNLIEFIPSYAPSGAVTAAQSMLLETAIESQSVRDILPKRIINPPIQAGLGATYATCIPALEAYECNTLLEAGSNDIITGFGQAQVANTVAPLMGITLHYSDAPPLMPQMYYDKPDNETSSGLAATTVTGGTITVNGGEMLQVLIAALAAGTITADESYIASMQFNSPNFGNSQSLEVPIQPNSVGLGALASALNVKASIYRNVNMPMKPTCTITTVLDLDNALTAAGNFIGCVGYTKPLNPTLR